MCLKIRESLNKFVYKQKCDFISKRKTQLEIFIRNRFAGTKPINPIFFNTYAK